VLELGYELEPPVLLLDDGSLDDPLLELDD